MKKMNLLWICPEMIYPANTGGRICSLKRIEYLSKNNSITLFCIIDNENERQYRNRLLDLCSEVYLYNRKDQKYLHLLRTLLYPYPFASRINSKMKKDINECYDRINPDYIIVDFPQMLGNLSTRILSSGKVVLNQHNIEYITLRNISNSIGSVVKKYIYRVESFRLKKLEAKFYKTNVFALYTFVSKDDMAFFEKKFDKNNTLLVPIGTELAEYESCMEYRHKKIMYFGKMSYPPNIDGAIWFIENVFSRLVQIYPDVELYIVGKDPLTSIKLSANKVKNVIVTGTVPDVADYYKEADLVIIPLFYGGGVKVKLIEALGYGKLVLSTLKGIEGTELQGDNQLLVANNADDFLSICTEYFKNRIKYEDVRKRGYYYAKNNYTWESIISEFESTLVGML